MKVLLPLFVFLCAAVIASPVFAQSKRMILLEEGTNASCAPCARENPTLEKYLEKPHIVSQVIPVVYHASWPGRDVMYSANTAMNTGRIVTYYAISGVPTVTVNGRFPTRVTGGWNGAPSDTTAINNSIATDRGMSPITIGIKETVNGASVDLEVSVHSTTALSNKKLQVVVTEGYHYYASAGTNGEKEFMYIARKMLPSHTGTTFSLNADETKYFNESFFYDTSWTATEMYIVAFVQDDATKEVLQAGTDRVHLDVTAANPAGLGAAGNTPMEFNAGLVSPIAGEYTVEVEKSMPTGWTYELKVNGVPVSDPAKITLDKDVPASVALTITPADSKNRLGKALVTIRGPLGGTGRAAFRLYSRDITSLLLVKDEGNDAIGAAYTTALDRGPYTYAPVAAGDESLFDLNTFPTVICEVGKSVLSQADVSMLKAYIDKGSRLFMIGAEIGWGLADPASATSGWYMDVPFLNNYLHADYVADDHAATTVRGATGDPIGDGMNVNYTGGVQNQDTPDVLRPRDGGIPVLYYGSTTDVAGFRWENSRNKLVFFGFGIEGISAVATRTELLRRGIEWLMSPTGTDEAPVQPVDLALSVHPNPAQSSWTVPVTLAKASTVRVSLYDMTGRLVALLAERDLAAGSGTLSFERGDIPDGSYMLHVSAGNRTASRLLHLAR